MTSNDLPSRETCREWLKDKNDRCNELAVGIIWGKLFPPGALGPRCSDHVAYHCMGRDIAFLVREGWAVYDLRPVNKLNER